MSKTWDIKIGNGIPHGVSNAHGASAGGMLQASQYQLLSFLISDKYAKTVTSHPNSSQKKSRIKIMFPSTWNTDGFGSVTLQNRIPDQIHGTDNIDDLTKRNFAIAVAQSDCLSRSTISLCHLQDKRMPTKEPLVLLDFLYFLCVWKFLHRFVHMWKCGMVYYLMRDPRSGASTSEKR